MPTIPVSGVPAVLPSALTTAKRIEDFSGITYPLGISGPSTANANPQNGRFCYNRNFLLQFMPVCKDKPDGIWLSHEIDPELTMRSFPRGMRPSQKPIAISTGSQPTAPKEPKTKRVRTKRGKINKTHDQAQAQPQASAITSTHTDLLIALDRSDLHDPVQMPPQPLAERRRWVAMSIMGETTEPALPEVVGRKVTALLNKMTAETFDSLSDQIIGWVNKSEDETGGHTLAKVTHLIFDKVTRLHEDLWLELYVRLCRKMSDQISLGVQDERRRNSNGKCIAGGELFRSYLLKDCNDYFEREWDINKVTVAASSLRQGAWKEDNTVHENMLHELDLNEYTIRREARRQGFIRFVGELFKLLLLTEHIVHVYIKRLLGKVDDPHEEDLKLLCKLLTAVGPQLNRPKSRRHMDTYFSQLEDLTNSSVKISPRTRFMLLDVLELRERNWLAHDRTTSTVHC